MAVRFALALKAHFARRCSEVEARDDLRSTDPRLAALKVPIASSALFYAGTLLLMLWALTAIRRHETIELHVRERGAGALDEVARRARRVPALPRAGVPAGVA
jgi:hypothetical protein